MSTMHPFDFQTWQKSQYQWALQTDTPALNWHQYEPTLQGLMNMAYDLTNLENSTSSHCCTGVVIYLDVKEI